VAGRVTFLRGKGRQLCWLELALEVKVWRKFSTTQLLLELEL